MLGFRELMYLDIIQISFGDFSRITNSLTLILIGSRIHSFVKNLLIILDGYKLAIRLNLLGKLRRLRLLNSTPHKVEEILPLAKVASTLLTLNTVT